MRAAFNLALTTGVALPFLVVCARCHAPNHRDHCGHDHEPRTKEIPAENTGARSGFDESPEQERRSDAANRGAGRVKKGNGQRTNFYRKDLGCRQIGGPSCRRRKKENYCPENVCSSALRR